MWLKARIMTPMVSRKSPHYDPCDPCLEDRSMFLRRLKGTPMTGSCAGHSGMDDAVDALAKQKLPLTRYNIFKTREAQMADTEVRKPLVGTIDSAYIDRDGYTVANIQCPGSNKDIEKLVAAKVLTEFSIYHAASENGSNPRPLEVSVCAKGRRNGCHLISMSADKPEPTPEEKLQEILDSVPNPAHKDMLMNMLTTAQKQYEALNAKHDTLSKQHQEITAKQQQAIRDNMLEAMRVLQEDGGVSLDEALTKSVVDAAVEDANVANFITACSNGFGNTPKRRKINQTTTDFMAQSRAVAGDTTGSVAPGSLLSGLLARTSTAQY